MTQTLTHLPILAAPLSDATAAESGFGGIAMTMVSFGLMILIFYFLLIRPEKKRAKKMKQMLEEIQIADEVVTSGGIIGRVLSIKEDTILIETGSDRTRLRVLRTAIIENRTIHDAEA